MVRTHLGAIENPEAGANEPQNCEPVRGFLHDLGTKTILLKYFEGLLKGAGTGSPREVDEWFVA
jgi:hypothetical protein